MSHKKFDVRKLEKLNDPGRLEQLDPRVMWDALATPSPATIVDIGAGTGLFASQFAEYAPDAEVFAVDIEPAMVDWMQQNLVERIGDRFKPILGSEVSVSLPDGSADVVVMIALHHEFEDPRANYAEALRLLAPGGRLLVADWRPGVAGRGPSDQIRAMPETVGAMLRSQRFSDVEIHPGFEQHWLLTASKPMD